MEYGRSIKIFLSDGSPTGLRHIEIANWSGQAIACPRSRFNDLQKWEEAKRPGVYLLFEKHSTDDKILYILESLKMCIIEYVIMIKIKTFGMKL
ncbi:MAG: hypothetical protein N4A32_06900 [Marinifilaceae bacterium]|jgi:hypothetical protein|nr:hypothetical protein [Marinifilaceae bacterium]